MDEFSEKLRIAFGSHKFLVNLGLALSLLAVHAKIPEVHCQCQKQKQYKCYLCWTELYMFFSSNSFPKSIFFLMASPAQSVAVGMRLMSQYPWLLQRFTCNGTSAQQNAPVKEENDNLKIL